MMDARVEFKGNYHALSPWRKIQLLTPSNCLIVRTHMVPDCGTLHGRVVFPGRDTKINNFYVTSLNRTSRQWEVFI